MVELPADEDFPLQGGSVGYLLDRKAAVFVFKRRLHTVTLLVFQGEGLPWSDAGLEPMGKVKARATHERGFNVVLWRAGELGDALASDLDPAELLDLGAKLSR